MIVTPATKATDIGKRLLSLINDCHSFRWVTAWANETSVLDVAIKSNKMISLVIGTHQYFTPPDVLDRCLSIKSVKVMLPKGPLFHPKLYAFDLGDRTEIFIGSSNLTHGGLQGNIECGVFLNGESDNPSLKNLVNHITNLWEDAQILNGDFMRSYKANYRRVRNALKELDTFVEIAKPKETIRSANNITPYEMDWQKFVKLVKADPTHGIEERLEVLSQARQLFAKKHSFADLSDTERKCIAGILKPDTLNDVHWGFFGQMSAFGSYNPLIKEHKQLFSKALDHIPIQGIVLHEHYQAYLAAFKKIPSASKTWIGMGTRLLAMKRPDYFVCIDNANRNGVCGSFSSAPTTTNLDNYWTRIIAPMMMTPWWQSEMPGDTLEQKIWMGRAAMLDAIYYDPDKR